MASAHRLTKNVPATAKANINAMTNGNRAQDRDFCGESKRLTKGARAKPAADPYTTKT